MSNNITEQEQLLQVKRLEVKSSQIKSIGKGLLENSQEALVIEFHNGAIWAYTPLFPATWDSFLNAESKGKFFNTHIKNCMGINAHKLQDKTIRK